MNPKHSDSPSTFAQGDGFSSAMTPSPSSGVGREVSDLAADLQDVVTATTSVTGAQLQHARDAVVSRARRSAAFTDQYVRANPWRATGYAAAAGAFVGLLLGVLLARR